MQTASTEVATRYVGVEDTNTRYYEAGTGPAMVLWHGDEFGGASSASTWLRNLPFNRSGHFPYREHPAEFNQIVTSFIHYRTGD
jgi:pimeloyl-ACP methyl ester carboxylesterase